MNGVNVSRASGHCFRTHCSKSGIYKVEETEVYRQHLRALLDEVLRNPCLAVDADLHVDWKGRHARLERELEKAHALLKNIQKGEIFEKHLTPEEIKKSIWAGTGADAVAEGTLTIKRGKEETKLNMTKSCTHPDHQADETCRDRGVSCAADCVCCLDEYAINYYASKDLKRVVQEDLDNDAFIEIGPLSELEEETIVEHTIKGDVLGAGELTSEEHDLLKQKAKKIMDFHRFKDTEGSE